MKEKALRLMEQALNIPQGTLQPDTAIQDVPQWDSLASLMILSSLAEELGAAIPVEQAMEFTKVSEYLAFVEEA